MDEGVLRTKLKFMHTEIKVNMVNKCKKDLKSFPHPP